MNERWAGPKPIETVYKGYRFRSRLEARWAVFFDELCVKWRYEVEGWPLKSGWYLPDFWLAKEECWVEIKPNADDENARKKAAELSEKKGGRVCLLAGDPWPGEYEATAWQSGLVHAEHAQLRFCGECGSLLLYQRQERPAYLRNSDPWVQETWFPLAGYRDAIVIDHEEFDADDFSPICRGCKYPVGAWDLNDDSLAEAYRAARQARFEDRR